jgi:hypothetical protein
VTTCAPLSFLGAKVGLSAAPGGAQSWGVFIRHIWGGYVRRVQELMVTPEEEPTEHAGPKKK